MYQPMLQLAFALALALSVGGVHARLTCSPAATGHPCAFGGIGTQGNLEPEPNMGIGNPVHLATGNKHQLELDLPSNPEAPLLQVHRHYNSLDPRHSPFGRGWSTSYDTRLYQVGGRIQIIQADGSRITFQDTDTSAASRRGAVQRDKTGWTWVWPDRRSLRFDSNGRLTRIALPARAAMDAADASQAMPAPSQARISAHTMDIVRHAEHGPLHGLVDRVVASSATSAGHAPTLQFRYRVHGGRAYVSTIDTPLGRFEYRYEALDWQGRPALRLAAMRRPDGAQRRYLYDADRQAGMPHLVTGVALAAPATHGQGAAVHTHSWAYDAQGRAIEAVQHHPAGHAYRLRIRYAQPATETQPGVTWVENANGQRTRLEFTRQGDRYGLAAVEGAACPGCPAPATRAVYTSQSRLAHMNGLQLVRTQSGAVQRVIPHTPGWPGLVLEFDSQGRRKAWRSDPTGLETAGFDSAGRVTVREFANGDQWRYRYDADGRPISIMARNQEASQLTRLRWDHNRLVAVSHPAENEQRRHDLLGRLVERRVQRPTLGREYLERFEYDDRNRPVVHHLPEGGTLRYRWDAQGRLLGIDWHDTNGRRHPVVTAWSDQTGYQYGNGLRLAVAYIQGHARALSVSDHAASYWQHFLQHDAVGRVTRASDDFPTMHVQRHRHYRYDDQNRLIASHVEKDAVRGSPAATTWYAWHADGRSAAMHPKPSVTPAQTERDSSGLPRTADGLELHYGPQRRLEQVRRAGRAVDRYVHNAFGHRIQSLSPEGDRHYFYLDNRLVAEAHRAGDSKPGRATGRMTRRYIYAADTVVGLIDYSGPDTAGALYAVHTDLIGQPRMVTDENKQLRWMGDPEPFGSMTVLHEELELNLRLPGQIWNATTGWHDNLLRTYDPRQGHYLEPDPLGPLPATQAWGYAAQQPARYTDPMGLLLFAFDGTRLDARNRSNVWLLSQRYQDGPIFYHSGPGNPHYVDLDAVVAHEAPQTIETQWQHLLNSLHGSALRADQPIPIDILGYSRGAALARHFGNLVAQHVDQGLFSYRDPLRGQVTACVDLRFMGLFDTVAQFGLNGALNSQYDFSISAAWGWVAHAVALHERRSLFPLLSAHASTSNVIEAPFVGAHADIGGGVSVHEPSSASTQGDLSDVALNWMLWQARAASVPWSALAAAQRVITEPILHDARSSLARTLLDGDRRVDAPDGSTQHARQDHHARLGQRQREATEALIRRYDDWHGSGSDQVGTVDLDAYARWLYDELGWHAAPAQATPAENHAMI